MVDYDFGLELTNNSKVGWAFSLARRESCIGATDICKKLCYGNGVRYQTQGQKAKRERNFRTVEFLLKEGGPGLLAENLSMLVDQARPRDWLTARITGVKTTIPFTLRVHDIGDFHTVDYVRAWFLTVKKHADCKFWFYTRSFTQSDLFAEMTDLAALPNCQGWLSIDSDNFREGILAKCQAPASIWSLALLQDKDLDFSVVSTLGELEDSVDIVSFPYHRGGRHVQPIRHDALTLCPAVVGGLSLKSSKDVLRPCQSCNFCLP